MGLFEKLFGGGGSVLSEEERGECEKMAELVDAAYMLSISSQMSFGIDAPEAGPAVRRAYHTVKERMGKKGTSAVYEMCLAKSPTIKDFLNAHWG